MNTPKVPLKIVELLAKSHFSEWTAEEKMSIDEWLLQDTHNQKLLDALQNHDEVVADLKLMGSFESLRGWNKQLSDLTSFEMNTPRGGQYKLTLPDGSRVWMNSDTRLAYREDSRQRIVDMDCEAYFEVKPQWLSVKHTKENLKPFTVKSNDQVVKVLGTHFNVKAYKDDNKIYTTLLEGSVYVKTDKQQILLYPGEQSVVSDGIMNKKKVDTDAIMAWKNGFFVFNAEPLEEILKQVGRWYNIDFVIESDRLKSETFEVMVPRFGELKELLSLLQKTGKLKFKNSGRQIYVTDK